jgi:hypothetical protein
MILSEISKNSFNEDNGKMHLISLTKKIKYFIQKQRQTKELSMFTISIERLTRSYFWKCSYRKRFINLTVFFLLQIKSKIKDNYNKRALD